MFNLFISPDSPFRHSHHRSVNPAPIIFELPFVWHTTGPGSFRHTVMTSVRAPAVAGAFYPGAAATLQAQVAALLAAARPPSQQRPKALIAPHAGYIYSGPVAANAYALLAPFRNDYSRVVLLGPAHRVYVRGLALPAADTFATPLGEIALDREAIAAIRHLPQVCISDDVHAHEHSLEVHLPFLQQALAGFTLVPLAVGEATAEQVAEVLSRLWGDERTLIEDEVESLHTQIVSTIEQKLGIKVRF